jgi:hypothetical protein
MPVVPVVVLDPVVAVDPLPVVVEPELAPIIVPEAGGGLLLLGFVHAISAPSRPRHGRAWARSFFISTS